MPRKMLIAVLCLSMLAAWPGVAYGAACFSIGSNTYTMDSQQQSMDVAPYIENGRTFLPVRFAAAAVGVAPDNISWSAAERQVTITKGSRLVKFVVGSEAMLLNGLSLQMDAAPEIRWNRVMVPVSFLAEAMGLEVDWNPATLTITLGEPQVQEAVSSNAAYTLDPLSYDSSVLTADRDLSWRYGGETYTWHVEVPQEMLDWDRQVNQLVEQFYSQSFSQQEMSQDMPDTLKQLALSDSVQAGGDLAPWVDDTDNSSWAGYLASRLAVSAADEGLDYFHTAEFIQSFVGGGVPYQLTDDPELPGQTIIDNGDCKDKSILLAAILKNLSYKVALLEFAPENGESGHMAVGIAFNDNQVPSKRNLTFYRSNGLKYYFAETTSPNWLLGVASIDEPASIYALN